MKVLLDECLPIDFRHSFPGHDVHTAEWAGFKGIAPQRSVTNKIAGLLLLVPIVR